MASTRPIKKATFFQLAFMIYGAVCAGAFGLEDMISGAGPGIAIITLIIVPFLFSIPVSYAVGELTTMLPVEGGQYRWSRMAFGDFWGFQAGWWAWMTGVVTNGIFAVLFANYVEYWLPAIRDYHLAALFAANELPPIIQNLFAKISVHWLICLSLIWFMHVLNLRGIQVVGNTAILLSIILLIPFAVMIGLGVATWQHSPFSPLHAPGKNLLSGFGSALVIAIWLYSGYDKLSAAAEEVENPQKIFPPALFFAATLAMLSYVLPTAAGLAALGNWQEWAGAYFSTAAARIGGAWLGHAMTFGALCSNALLLNVTMLAASRYPLTLAEDGFLPKFLTRLHPAHGTPAQALFWGSITYSALALFDFSQLTIIYSWFQMSSYILLYANVWAMRRTHAEMQRPFKIPFGKTGLFLAMLPTCVIALVAMGSMIIEDGHLGGKQLLIGELALMSGPIVYQIVREKVEMIRRPIGVTIISWVLVFFAIIEPLLLLTVFFSPKLDSLFILIIFLVFPIPLVMGLGMLNGYNWARMLFLWLSPIFILVGLLTNTGIGLWTIFIFYIISIVTLTSPNASTYFK